MTTGTLVGWHRVAKLGRQRLVVGLDGSPAGEVLLRRAAGFITGGMGGELLAVHVVSAGRGAPTRQQSFAAAEVLERQRDLIESLGGSFHSVYGDDIAQALVDFARGSSATQLVLGAGRGSGPRRTLRPAIRRQVEAVIQRGDAGIDVLLVNVVAQREGAAPRPATADPRPAQTLGRRRRLAGGLLGLLGPALLTAALAPHRDSLELSTPLVLFMVITVAVAMLGGLWPSIVAAITGGLLLNWFFTPPFGTLSINDPQNAVALIASVLVAAAVASVVDLAARRTAQAAHSAGEAEALSMLAGGVLRGENTVDAVLARVRETFAMTAAGLLERKPGARGERRPWSVVASSGGPLSPNPEDADETVVVSDHLILTMTGRRLAAADRRVLAAFASQAAVVLERQRLREQAAHAADLEHHNKTRTALLAAVSHDLRTPLASVKAAVSSLRQPDVHFTPDDEAELLATVEEGADRLERLIENLLDVSRLQTGAVVPLVREVALDEVVPRALESLPIERFRLDIDEDLPLVTTDPGLLERIVANIAENALKHAGGDAVVQVSATCRAAGIELRVIDQGRGVAADDKRVMFAPFQRTGDAPAGSGVGLGLAVARGFAEALGGHLEAEDTPGGGLTMVLTLPVAGREPPR